MTELNLSATEYDAKKQHQKKIKRAPLAPGSDTSSTAQVALKHDSMQSTARQKCKSEYPVKVAPSGGNHKTTFPRCASYCGKHRIVARAGELKEICPVLNCKLHA